MAAIPAKDKIKQVILSLFIFFWVLTWVKNFGRDFSNNFEKTKKLCGKSLQEKWSYVFGADLYKLLLEGQRIIPPEGKISFIHHLDTFTSMMSNYFLYPRANSDDGDFVLVYKQAFNNPKNSKVIYLQAQDIFIIRK